MKLRGRIVDHVVLADGRQRLTFETADDFRMEYDRLKDKPIAIEPKVWRQPRSLDQNAYFHLLVNKIAAAVGSSDDEVKRDLVIRYGAMLTDADGSPYGVMLPEAAEPSRCFKRMELNGRQYRCFLLYRHTRDMDSGEMSRLIDGTVSEAKALGIETMPPEELAALYEQAREIERRAKP